MSQGSGSGSHKRNNSSTSPAVHTLHPHHHRSPSPSPQQASMSATIPLSQFSSSISSSSSSSSLINAAGTAIMAPPHINDEKEIVPTKNGAASSKVKSKLNVLSTRFQGFQQELNLTRDKKKNEEDERIISLQNQLTSLQESLSLESKNRQIAVKALQAWLTDRIEQWTIAVEQPFTNKISSMNSRIDSLNGRLEELEKKHEEDRVSFPQLIDGRCADLLRDIRELNARVISETNAREEKDKRILFKLQDQGVKLTNQFVSDKSMVDARITQIRQELTDEINIRHKGYDMIKSSLAEEIASLKAQLDKEKTERESADDDLVQAINHYTAALQDGIKIVSTH